VAKSTCQCAGINGSSPRFRIRWNSEASCRVNPSRSSSAKSSPSRVDAPFNTDLSRRGRSGSGGGSDSRGRRLATGGGAGGAGVVADDAGAWHDSWSSMLWLVLRDRISGDTATDELRRFLRCGDCASSDDGERGRFEAVVGADITLNYFLSIAGGRRRGRRRLRK
jgi:hypothetical protein